MHPFRQYIANYTSMPQKDWEQVEQLLEKRQVSKGSTILSEGKICRHLYFLENGLLRFFVWKDGRDVSKFFTIAPYCFTSQRSYSLHIPAQENIEALEDSTIWQIDREKAEQLMTLKSWNTFVLALVQEVQFFTEQILEDLQNETAEDRYKRMLENGNELLHRVPLKHLASFLGIAPQSLSRIRKKILSKQQLTASSISSAP